MKKFLIASVVMAAVALLGASSARATVFASDSFTYGNGDLPTQSSGVWSNISPATGAMDVQVVNDQAEVSGARTGDDWIKLTGTPHSNDKLYAGFDFEFTGLPGAANTTYFANFAASSSTFWAKVFGTNDGGQVKIGITGQANTATSVWASDIALNSWHHIVTEVDQTDGWPATIKLWLDPSSEGSTFIAPNDNVFSTNQNIIAFLLRESNTPGSEGTILVDNLVVASTFSEVIPEPSTILLVGTGLLGLLAIRRRRS